MTMYNLLDEFGNVILTTPDFTIAFQCAMEQIEHEFASEDAYRVQVIQRRYRGTIQLRFFVYFDYFPDSA